MPDAIGACLHLLVDLFIVLLFYASYVGGHTMFENALYSRKEGGVIFEGDPFWFIMNFLSLKDKAVQP